jgi:hypothetical protein
MKPLSQLLVAVAAALVLGGCGIKEPGYCDPPVPPYELFVGMHDSLTSRPLARGTIGTADAPGVHDTLVTFGEDSTTLYSAHNAPGTYRVLLRREGYRDWIAEDVKVEWGRCGGDNVALGARLQPIAPPA